MPHNPVPYTGGLLDTNTYYPVKNIKAYPASNSVDTAKLLSEGNLRNMHLDITDINYVVSPNPGGYDISLTADTKVNIKPGIAMINGFEIDTNIDIQYRLPTENEVYTGDKYKDKYEGMALLCLHTIFDALNNMSGNTQVGSTWYFEGIHVCYPTVEEYENHEIEYLLLGGVSPTGEIKINDEKYTRIDAKYILLRLLADPETGAPPKQSTNLLEFVNNYLHSYWLSKAGDHEYGNITLRKKPDQYLRPGFNYEQEDLLSDTNYAIKFGRKDIVSALTDNPTSQEGYINLKLCDDEQYPNYVRQTHFVPAGAYIKEFNDDIDNYNLFTGYINHNDKSPAFEQEVDSPNTYLTRITNSANAQSIIGNPCLKNDIAVNAGNVVFDSDGFGENHPYSFKLQFAQDLFYIGAYNKTKEIQNDLYSINDSISTTYSTDPFKYINIDISAPKQQITFTTRKQEAYIHLRPDAEVEANSPWRDVLDLGKNVEIEQNVWAHGFIVAGTKKNVVVEPDASKPKDIGKDPTSIEVPDFYNNGKYRKLQEGDIYANQVWSGVYNDIAERFDVKGVNVKACLIISQNTDGDYIVCRRKYAENIIGVISENPAICMGGNGAYAVALAGRVRVYYHGKKPKIGDYVGLSNTQAGYATKCNRFSKYCIGKVTNIEYIEDNIFVEVLVK